MNRAPKILDLGVEIARQRIDLTGSASAKNDRYGLELPMTINVIPGYQTLYPGSHELRPIALVRAAESLAGEAPLVIARLEERSATDRDRQDLRPEEVVELLFELGASLTRQAELTRSVLSMTVPRTE